MSFEPGCRTYCFGSNITCEPLKTLRDIQLFLTEPPIWRTLCKPLVPHSKYVMNSKEIDHSPDEIDVEYTESYCHFDPESDTSTGATAYNEGELPKLLVCHDMCNGYHDDSPIDGTPNYDAYTFYNWAAVDIFCYFSHHLVTVPPLGWINAAHAHGVKVIGTFITEWTDGVTFWNNIFSEETGCDFLVNALVTIAKTLKFEGWLINVENKISQPRELIQFVENLTKALHQEIPEGVVIWYDSVTKEGHLTWQNRLNEKNRPFFDACDGIFTNYSWSELDIIMSAEAARSRLHDVYVGVDVWGRNFYGGGMFNTQEAVKLIHKYGCSMAVFAPAWTHEAMGADGDSSDLQAVAMADHLRRIERFLIRDRALWGSLWPFLKTRLPCSLPFKTSFCRGLGTKRRMYGEVLCNNSWFNLRHMQYQPNAAHGPHGYVLSTEEKIRRASVRVVPDGHDRKYRTIRESLHQINYLNEDEDETKDNVIDVKNQETVHNENNVEEKTEEHIISVNDMTLKSDDDKQKTIDDETDDDKIDTKKFARHRNSTEVAMHDGSKWSRVKRAVRKLIGLKTSSQIENATPRQELPETNLQDSRSITLHTPEHSSSLIASTGRSMVLTSMHMKLGRSKKRYSVAYVCDERECLENWLDDSFIGGTCLKINPSDGHLEEHRTIRLFQCDFVVKRGESLVVCMVTKMMAGFKQWLNMWLYASSWLGESRFELVGRTADGSDAGDSYFPLDTDSVQFKELRSYLLINHPDFYLSPANSYEWKIMYYELPVAIETRVTSINLRTGHKRGAILLGHVGLCTRVNE